MSIKNYANFVGKKIDPDVLIKFNKKKIRWCNEKKLNLTLANSYGWKSEMNFSKAVDKTIEDFKNFQN